LAKTGLREKKSRFRPVGCLSKAAEAQIQGRKTSSLPNLMRTFYPVLAVVLLLFGPLAVAQDVLTNSDIVAMNDARVARSLISQKINASTCNFDVGTPGLIALKTAKVPEPIIETMLARSPSRETLSNDDVIRLYEAGLSRGLITKKIQGSPSRFDLTPTGLIRLRAAKVPDALVKAMMTTSGAGGDSAPAPRPTPARNNRQSTSGAGSDYAPPTTAKATAAPEPSAKSGRNCEKWYDKFTKKEVRASRVVLRGWKPGAVALNSVVGQGMTNALGIEDMEVHLIFRRDGNALTLVLYASKPGVHTMSVSRNKPLMLLMQDESVLEFLPAERSESEYTWGGGYSMESNLLMYYQLRPDQVNILATKLVKEYRLNLYNRHFAEDTVPEHRARQVRAGAVCVL